MNTEMIDKFIKKTSEIFLIQYKQKIIAGKPYILQTSDDHGWDISGFVGVTGSSEGLLAIRFPNSVANKLFELSKVTAPKYSEKLKIINDMTGELTNIICGNVLSEVGKGEFRLSIPITIQGKNHITSWPKQINIIAIPFHMTIGLFELQISLIINGEAIS